MMTALIAAIPEPKAKPCLPFSKLAITLSIAVRVISCTSTRILVLSHQSRLVNTYLFGK